MTDTRPTTTLRVTDFGGSILIMCPDSKRLFGRIVELLIFEQHDVVLDFENVERITAAYLNEAVGQLYRVISKKFLKERMQPPVNIRMLHLVLLKTVIDNAKHTHRRFEKS